MQQRENTDVQDGADYNRCGEVTILKYLVRPVYSLQANLVLRSAIILYPVISAWRTVCVLFFLAAFCTASLALDSDRTIAQYAHTAWGQKEGAPDEVTALSQTTDGYLWLGSPDGLYRFDGVVFERYQPRSGDLLPARTVHSLLALPNGDLWIGFRSGAISLLRNGKVTNYTTRDGVPEGTVMSLAQDREGTIWAATGSGLARLEGGRWKKVEKDWNFTGELARAIFLDRQGTLWVATENTLVFLPAGTRRFQPTGIRVGQVNQITQAANGKLWMAETSRSVRPIPLSDKRQPSDETEIQVGSVGILFDKDGALWITSMGDGLRRTPAPELLKGKVGEFSHAVDSFTAKDELSSDVAGTILQDREGNIWVGTRNGLDRFRKTNLVPILLPFLSPDAVWVAGDAGDIWVANRDVTRQGLLQLLSRRRAIRVREKHVEQLFPGKQAIEYAYRDPVGVVWWLRTDAIYRYNAGSYTRLELPSSFPKPYLESGMVATEDASGTLWLDAARKGLFYRKKGGWQRFETASEFGKLSPVAAFTDWKGRMWFGCDEGTIIVLKDEKIQRVLSADNSPVGGVRAIGGRGRHVWIGGESGLAFFDGNRFRRIIPADAETFNSVMGVEETPSGGLWLAESRGVIEISATEAQHALGDPSYRVKYRLFDTFDGLPGKFAGVAANPKELQGSDGVLWFVASNGIAWVDPANVSTNTIPPPVLIRSVRTNGRLLDEPTNLVLPPRTTDLQIGYTALSLSVPGRVHFRYRLEGVDKGWRDAGPRREAFYTRLGPGKYHFQVIASNNDGVWNDEGAHLDFRIAPTWYETKWFQLLCGLISVFLLWTLYQLRMRQMERQFMSTLGARVDERTRIARELHDTLLQSFHGIMFQFQAARNLLPRKPESAMQAMDEAIVATEQAIAEGRDAIHDLRPKPGTRHDLAALLTTAGRELAAAYAANGPSPSFCVIVEGKPQKLSPTLQDETYRISREVIRNAFHHASANRIEVEVRYDENQLRIRIRDNGKGIDSKVLEGSGRPGHWGLPGIRERAQRIGSRLELWSKVGAGTEVELSVPAAIAYEKQLNSYRFRLFHMRRKQ